MEREDSEAGMALPEMLAAMATGLVVLGAVLTFIFVAVRQHDATVDRVTARDASAVGLERMQRELRQALEIDPSPGSAPVTTGVLRVRLWVRSGGSVAQHWVRYDCTTVASTCTRRDETAGTAATKLVDGLTVGTGASTFTLTPPRGRAVLPTLALTLSRSIEGATAPITLTSTVTPRNCQEGLPAGSSACPG